MKNTTIGAVMAATMLVAGCGKKSPSSSTAPTPEQADAASASDNPKKSPPTFQVQAYQIDGENFLPPEKLSGTLTNYTGTVDMARISMEANKLQAVYRQAGYTNVKVVIPPQRFTNGIIHLKAVIIDSKDK